METRLPSRSSKSRWTRRDYFRQQLQVLPLVLAFLVAGLCLALAPAITAGVTSALLFALALCIFIQDRRFARSGRRAQGVVVDHQYVEDCFLPVVEFRDNLGNLHRENSRTGTGQRKPAVGKQVIVLYDPTGKRACEIDRFWWRHVCLVVVLLIAAGFAFGAVYGK